MVDSNYVRLVATKSRCGLCNENLTLIQHRNIEPQPGCVAPMFYICWHCQRVIEAGVAEVLPEE